MRSIIRHPDYTHNAFSTNGCLIHPVMCILFKKIHLLPEYTESKGVKQFLSFNTLQHCWARRICLYFVLSLGHHATRPHAPNAPAVASTQPAALPAQRTSKPHIRHRVLEGGHRTHHVALIVCVDGGTHQRCIWHAKFSAKVLHRAVVL